MFLDDDMEADLDLKLAPQTLKQLQTGNLEDGFRKDGSPEIW
jgi:hypothetical protein